MMGRYNFENIFQLSGSNIRCISIRLHLPSVERKHNLVRKKRMSATQHTCVSWVACTSGVTGNMNKTGTLTVVHRRSAVGQSNRKDHGCLSAITTSHMTVFPSLTTYCLTSVPGSEYKSSPRDIGKENHNRKDNNNNYSMAQQTITYGTRRFNTAFTRAFQ